MAIALTGKDLTIEKLVSIARGGDKVELDQAGRDRIEFCRRFLERKLASGERIYGTNTGVGEFCETLLSPEQLEDFQRKMIYSHAAGIGEEMPAAWVRGAMAARVNVHAQGFSGCRSAIAQTLVDMLNRGVTPLVSLKGSVGACGDLAPMAEIALLFLGEGKARYRGEVLDGGEAMQRAGIPLPGLKVRDGLAAINGSNFITAAGALQVADIRRFLRTAEIACAMSMEALNANLACLDARIHEVRGFAGSIRSARFMLECLEGGDLREGRVKTRIQDAYSIRSTPQVIGAAHDALAYAEVQVVTELNGVGDNPIFHPDDEAILTGANFQGCPVSLPMEMLGMAVTSVCVLSERRLNRLLDKALSGGLPMFLVPGNGLNSGMMISQYTACSLIAEQRILANPAYAGSIPGAGSQEDFVSMGMTTAIKTQEILDNAWGILAIELMAAAQAMDLRGHAYGKVTARAHAAIRRQVRFLDADRPLVPDHNALKNLIASGEFLAAIDC